MKRESIDERVKREIAILDLAEKEPPFTSANLIEELSPIIAEYFVCNYESEEK